MMLSRLQQQRLNNWKKILEEHPTIEDRTQSIVQEIDARITKEVQYYHEELQEHVRVNRVFMPTAMFSQIFLIVMQDLPITVDVKIMLLFMCSWIIAIPTEVLFEMTLLDKKLDQKYIELLKNERNAMVGYIRKRVFQEHQKHSNILFPMEIESRNIMNMENQQKHKIEYANAIYHIVHHDNQQHSQICTDPKCNIPSLQDMLCHIDLIIDRELGAYSDVTIQAILASLTSCILVEYMLLLLLKK